MIRSLKVILTYLVFATCFSVCHSSEKNDFVVIIDPGHGGRDYGAIGRLTNEKTINLNVALRLNDMLEKHKGITPVLTRDKDTYLQLQERADIANKAGGDLFISIHVNSLDRRSKKRNTIEGASVYTLGLHKTGENFDVAKRENSVIALEPDFTTTYHGFDPNSSESYIIFEMSQNQHLAQSINFASTVQSQLINGAGRSDRGVRQAGFWVLMATSMPSVLVELDFICNPRSEKFLNSKSGQTKLATAIYKAIVEYTKQKFTDTSSKSIDNVNIDIKNNDIEESDTKIDSFSPIYKIQILASAKSIKAKSDEFKGLTNINHYKENGLYKYTIGEYNTLQDAEKNLKKIKKKFPSAFIIEWANGKRTK